jgi:DNA-binding NarL/FixJ family response regulator
LRVLLADDHGIVRRGLRSLLESEPGLTVVADAADGLEALRLCEEHRPDVLILDVAMPKLNGIEVAVTDSYHLLTDREKEVLQLLAEGRSNKEVAMLLDIGLSTIETHRANLMQKLNLHNTAEIVLYAVRKRIIV